MKFDKNLAALLALCAILLILAYVASQKGQQAQNNGIINEPQVQLENTAASQNRTQNGSTAIANPASVYCIQHGGIIKIITDPDGSQRGICVFPDGSQCDEWAYYRGECSPANRTAGQAPEGNITGLGGIGTPGGNVSDLTNGPDISIIPTPRRTCPACTNPIF